jgi:chromosome segregation ATPase
MESIDAALFLAVTGAALLAARAFRSMTGIVIDLIQELRSVLSELRTSERENTVLEAQVHDFDMRMEAIESGLNDLNQEIQHIKAELQNWRSLHLVPKVSEQKMDV